MEGLVRIIGPAPSELSKEALVARLAKERNRVREALQEFRASFNKPRPSTASKRPRKDPLADLAAQHNLSVEELRSLLGRKGELLNGKN